MPIESPQNAMEQASLIRREVAEWLTRSKMEKFSAACLGLAALFTYLSNWLRKEPQVQNLTNPGGEQAVIGISQTLAIVSALTGIVLFVIVIRKSFDRQLFEGFVGTYIHMAEALQERLSRADVLQLEKLFELVHYDRNLLSPVDHNHLVREWLIHFVDVVSGAHEENRQITCFSFQSLAAPKILTSSQLQLIALQTRLCLRRQYDPVTRTLHSCAPALFLDRLHRSALSNIKNLFLAGGKYAKGRYLSSRIRVANTHEGEKEIEAPGLVRVLFWTEEELKSECSQRYLSIWDAFGIPTFWIERNDTSCKIIIDTLRELPQDSKIRQTVKKIASPEVDSLLRDGWSKGKSWPCDLDFITVDDQVVMGYGNASGAIDWYKECSTEFAAFLARICDLLANRVFYASEASWHFSSNGRSTLSDLRQRSGFVLLHDFFVEEAQRLAGLNVVS